MCDSLPTGSLEALAADIDRLQVDAEKAATAALPQDLRELRREMDRMEAVFSRMVQRFDAAQEYVSEGSVSLIGRAYRTDAERPAGGHLQS
jgi:predicted urease superfamily metal-dependent hydrolase